MRRGFFLAATCGTQSDPSLQAQDDNNNLRFNAYRSQAYSPAPRECSLSVTPAALIANR